MHESTEQLNLHSLCMIVVLSVFDHIRKIGSPSLCIYHWTSYNTYTLRDASSDKMHGFENSAASAELGFCTHQNRELKQSSRRQDFSIGLEPPIPFTVRCRRDIIQRSAIFGICQT
jgi:hypothetical protein